MSNINITLPDGSVKQFEAGVTALDVAKSISEGLARNVLSAKVNGEVWDATRPLTEDTDLTLLTWNDDAGKSTMWHSSAHLMAEALEFHYPGIKLAIGPPIENGFYYDVDFGEHNFTEEDLGKVEKKMLELAREKNPYIRKEMPKAEAIAHFKESEDQYKLELLEDLEDGNITFIPKVTSPTYVEGRTFPTPDTLKLQSYSQ